MQYQDFVKYFYRKEHVLNFLFNFAEIFNVKDYEKSGYICYLHIVGNKTGTRKL